MDHLARIAEKGLQTLINELQAWIKLKESDSTMTLDTPICSRNSKPLSNARASADAASRT
jgi:hypothetical protein